MGAQPLLLGCVDRTLHRRRVAGNPEGRIESRAAPLWILGLVSALLIGIERSVACRQAEIGCPLKDVKMLRLPGDDRYRLDARRAGANDTDPQAGEIGALMRPQASVVPFPLETLQTRVVRRPRRRKIARRHDAEPRGRDAAFVSRHGPCVALAVEGGLLDPSVEFDIAPQIETIGHMIHVTQDLRLRAVALGPMPFLLQLVGEGIRVLHALDIAAAPRVTVPGPGAAHIAGGFECAHFEAELAQAVDRVETANAGADDNRIEPRGFGASG